MNLLVNKKFPPSEESGNGKLLVSQRPITPAYCTTAGWPDLREDRKTIRGSDPLHYGRTRRVPLSSHPKSRYPRFERRECSRILSAASHRNADERSLEHSKVWRRLLAKTGVGCRSFAARAAFAPKMSRF